MFRSSPLLSGWLAPVPSPVLSICTALFLTAFFATGCGEEPGSEAVEDAAGARQDSGAAADPHSSARPEEIAVSHLALDLDVDFDQRQLAGEAVLTLERRDPAARQLVLDTRKLEIESVAAPGGDGDRPLEHSLGEDRGLFGQALTIQVPEDAEVVKIHYRTSPGADALQWLEPAQTAGGEHSFLFTQSQSILARSWIPLQDTPGVRMTYEATVRVPPQLLALMSAGNPTEKNADGVYHFRMDQPIPAYLMALAVGDLVFEPLGEVAGVYAEPSVLARAAAEFADTEAMMAAAEGLYGPYRWDRYDILVLPPSFPFGGMENPRLTFATPTILAGDKSLVALIAHELAHSWSGNLVTNATWNDFWLNEGFTVYIERRIMEELYGRDYAEMLWLLGRQDLEASLEALEPMETHLRLDLAADRDPDDALTDIAYEKGAFFLRTIEETFGRPRFDAWLRGYFERNAFQPMTTSTFLEDLDEHLLENHADLRDDLQILAWIDGPGVPANAPEIQSEAFAEVEAQIAAWEAGAPAEELATAGWNTHQWLHFLRHLPEPMSQEQMADLDSAFALSDSGNSERLHAWLMQAIANDYQAAYPALETFLTTMGRRKFLRPLYTELAKTEAGRARAEAIYTQARPTYHPVSVSTLDEILAWD